MAVVIPRGLVNPPPPVVSESADGRLRATVGGDGAGVLLEADFSAESPEPYQVRFYRRTAAGDVPVRSGDPAWAPGGQAVAYDAEMPLGVGCRWIAVPYFRTADPDGQPGAPSDDAALLLAFDRRGDRTYWMKSVDHPALSMRLTAVMPLPVMSRPARLELTDVPGSAYPAARRNRRQARVGELSVLTETFAERDRALDLLDSGTVLLQADPSFGMADFFLVAGEVTETPAGAGMDDPSRVLTWPMTEVARAATVDAALVVPGRSYADTARVASSYAEAASIWPTYADVIRS